MNHRMRAAPSMRDGATLPAALRKTAESVGLLLDEPTADALGAYTVLLQRWNGVYNLTSIRDPARMLTHHLADCLAVIEPLRRELAESGDRRPCILDVGSGGGLPGAVIAIVCPEVDVVCIDAVAKKAAFVRQVGAEVGVPNLRPRHARAESLQRPEFDLVVSRAFASLAATVVATEPSLAPTGRWMAMKGKRPMGELAQLPPSIEAYRVDDLVIPTLKEDRCLVWMKRSTAVDR